MFRVFLSERVTETLENCFVSLQPMEISLKLLKMGVARMLTSTASCCCWLVRNSSQYTKKYLWLFLVSTLI